MLLVTKTLRAAGGLAVLALAANGCIIVDDDHRYVITEERPYHTTIDADFVLSTDLGYGAGLFVEYARGGLWRLWTSCDTAVTGRYCFYEVNVTSYGRIDWVEGIDLEPSDGIETYGSNGLTFFADTGRGSDAIEFAATPGELLSVELVLDGYLEPSYIVWFGNDAVREGAPRSPVVFQPDAP